MLLGPAGRGLDGVSQRPGRGERRGCEVPVYWSTLMLDTLLCYLLVYSLTLLVTVGSCPRWRVNQLSAARAARLP